MNDEVVVNSVSLIGWVPPKENFVKVNTDSASKNNNVAGCGGVVRGSHGEWVGGFAKCVGRSSALVAETWGVLEELRYAWRLEFQKVELNVDSITLVKMIENRSLHSALGGIFGGCWIGIEWSKSLTYI
ncbi:ribonuclease H [Trifolium pratense]|uniref:Ribonuclease H n=1 Tax=Trifolium pratense TaxID=57577 RepID=A0A2K3M1D2_TRIPR|nr:ribonuclease H [Trifolium pratense]